MNLKISLGLSGAQGHAQARRAFNNDGIAKSIAAWTVFAGSYSSDSYATIVRLNDTDIVVAEANKKAIRTLRWNGTTFVQIGTALSVPIVSADTLIGLSDTRVAWVNHTLDQLHAYDWDGTNWTAVGHAFDFGDMSGYANGDCLTDNDFVIWGGNAAPAPSVARLTFDGTNWSRVGAPLPASGAYVMPIKMGESRIALLNTGADILTAYDWTGTGWAQVGDALTSLSLAGKLGGAYVADNKIAVWDSSNRIQALHFDGTNFLEEGTPAIIGASSWPRSMAMLGDGVLAAHYYGSGGHIKAVNAVYE